MNIIVIFLLFASTVATNYDILESGLKEFKRDDHLVINQLKDNEVEHPELVMLPTRAARVRGSKKHFCGRRLAGFIFATCGECEPGFNEDISLLCCIRQCDIQDVIEACCPNIQ
ncbi:hypothetical protein GCK72_006159 [Caenorhabditis remanei]|uniref:CRE-INS-2 protein n=2 Tax=Caenorhabditis remanei TaxID=31234 RepID=E3LRE1_CAERE|nr:hypothetical protein GCK72_006159 [Caenorhabditis remanei]EFP07614.1 CRE-INS-2 protein [Caenorhabditis remanei]KAF1766203.1 hypothetical protein GCK72_006159 [Caenorhabditis remanei]